MYTLWSENSEEVGITHGYYLSRVSVLTVVSEIWVINFFAVKA